LKNISDYLFFVSLAFMVITFIIFFVGRGTPNQSDLMIGSGGITDLQLKHNHQETLTRQDDNWAKLLKSYLFWIPFIGIVLSIILSKI
jgi:hypothetical protein